VKREKALRSKQHDSELLRHFCFIPVEQVSTNNDSPNKELALPFHLLTRALRFERRHRFFGILLLAFAYVGSISHAQDLAFRDLFNGKDLSGWIDVNTSPATWSVKDGLLICTGQPIGVMRTDRQYENFIIEVEWRHMEPGGNSGMFLWSDAKPEGNRLPRGMEVQMLELDWVNQHKGRNGTLPPIAYVHGELFGAGGMTAIPDNPRGSRSKSLENRCKGVGEWNRYVFVAVDGMVKLSVNGKFVNGIRDASYKKGYICLESEGKEIHFRKIRIMELPNGLANANNTAPLIKPNQKEEEGPKK
jgi:hypothetical protein